MQCILYSVERKQLYLTRNQNQRLRERAAAEGRPEAAIVREALDRYIAEDRGGSSEHPLLGLIGMARGGKRHDSARRHDDYLYRSDDDVGESDPGQGELRQL